MRKISCTIYALDAQGKWVRAVEDMGFPAGLERTMVADLTGKLPAGTLRPMIPASVSSSSCVIPGDPPPLSMVPFRRRGRLPG